MEKNTRALTNVQIPRTKCSTDQKPAKGPSRLFLLTSSPAPRKYWAPAVNRQPLLPPGDS
eukprot:3025472-Pyramimonas_sp.AAC.1